MWNWSLLVWGVSLWCRLLEEVDSGQRGLWETTVFLRPHCVYVCSFWILIDNSGMHQNIPSALQLSLLVSRFLSFFLVCITSTVSDVAQGVIVLLAQDTSNALPLQFTSLIHTALGPVYFRNRWEWRHTLLPDTSDYKTGIFSHGSWLVTDTFQQILIKHG